MESTTVKYYQQVSIQDILPVKLQTKKILLVEDRDFWTDEIIHVEKSLWINYWVKGRIYLLPFLVVLPFILFPIEILKKAWITSLFGLIACCLPSGGAPIAGGIVFIPFLQMLGLSPKQAVAFCSASQAVGCGIFTPLNWYSKDQGIFIKSSIPISLFGAIIGLYLSLFHFPLDEHQVGIFFAYFCIFLAFTVIHGLFHDLTIQDQPVKFDKISKIIVYFIVSLIGGMIAGYIGIGVEKLYFLLVTFYDKGELKRSTISAITIIGWLSIVSAFAHLFIMQDVPLVYWVCSLPGILLGSMIGPIINSHLGSFKIMMIFCGFLFLNVIYELTK